MKGPQLWWNLFAHVVLLSTATIFQIWPNSNIIWRLFTTRLNDQPDVISNWGKGPFLPLASPCSPFISIHKPRFCNNNTTWLTLHEVQNRYLSMYTSLPSSLHVWQSFITIGWCQKVGVFVLLLGLCLAMAICHRSQSVHSYNSGQKSCITTTGWCQKVVVPVLQAQLTATGSNSRLCIGSFSSFRQM